MCKLAYSIQGKFLIVTSIDLKQQASLRKAAMRYAIMQIPEQYLIKEAVFHFNSLSVRDEGKCQEELIVMCQHAKAEETIVKTIELEPLEEAFGDEYMAALD